MSESNQNASGNPSNSSGDASGSNNPSPADEGNVSRASYLKLLNEKKKERSENAKMREELEELRLQKMQAEGDKDQMIQTLSEKLKLESEQRKKQHQVYAWNSVKGQITSKAKEMGCVDTNSLIKLIDKDEINSLQINDDFTVATDQVEGLLNKAKETYSSLNLFSKKSVNVNNPSSYAPPQTGKSLSEMTDEELDAEIRKASETEQKER